MPSSGWGRQRENRQFFSYFLQTGKTENFGNIKDIFCQEKNHQVENELVTMKVLAWRIPKTSAQEFKCSFFQTEKRQEICLKPPKAQRKGFKNQGIYRGFGRKLLPLFVGQF